MKRSTVGALLVVLLSSLPTSAQLQPEPGDITLSPDPRGRVGAMDVQPLVPFELYVVATDPPGGISNFEVAIEGLSSVPDLFVLENELVTAGLDVAAGDFDYVVPLYECAAGSFVRLIRLTLLAAQQLPADSRLCLGGPTLSSFDGSPGYYDCTGAPRPFGLTDGGLDPDGCLILDPTVGCDPQTFYGMPERLAQPGDTVRIPLTSDVVPQPGGPQCTPPSVFGVEGVLRFDPSILSFDDVTIGGAAPDWPVSFDERAPGEIEIVAGATETTDLFGASSLPDLGGDALLQLAFEVLAPGTADMVLEMRECRVTAGDPGPCSLSATRIVRGAVTQDPVRNDRASFGSLKARFGQ